MNSRIQFVKRVLLYCTGLMVLAFGIAISINSNLGISPVSSLPYVVSLILDTNMSKGIIIVYTISVLLQILILRKEFKPINLFQLLITVFFGYFTDFARFVIGDFVIPTYFGKIAMILISTVLVASGLCLYINAKLISMPIESLIQAVAYKITKKPFHDTKVIIDSSMVIIAIGLSLTFLGRLEGVREGTIISAILVGKCMKQVRKVIIPFIDKYVFKEEPLEELET